MPRTYVVATPTGSGVNVDAVQTSLDSDIRQVVVLGDPDNDTFLQTIDSSGRANVSITDLDAITSSTITAIDAVVGAPAGAGQMVTGASTAGSLVSMACPGGDAAWSVAITGGTFTTTLYFEESLDSTTGIDGNWINCLGRQTGVASTTLAGSTSTNNTFWRGSMSAAKWFRVRAVGGAITTGPTITIRHSSGSGALFLNASIPAGANLIGGDTPTPSAAQPGLTPFFNNALVATVVSVKASAGKVHGWHFYNPSPADAFVQFFDLATGSVTLGTTVPKKSIWVPSLGSSDYESTLGVGMLVAISIAATTTSNGLTAPATGLVTNMDTI